MVKWAIAADSPDRPDYEPVREVRFAIVMYGGVSLAIYINGVVQELFRLVRATAPDKDGKLLLAEEELSGSERVYRELGQRLSGAADGRWAGTHDPAAPVASRFVVDILSGTSAGGINAIFLAKALANGENIDGLRDLWVEEGDIDKLLNEKGAYEGLDAKYSAPPSSLLAGDRLYERALAALDGMTKPSRASYADRVDLAVTTTDLQGLRLPVQLSDGEVQELRHRMVLWFRYAREQLEGTDLEHSDFTKDEVPMLAFAARATSSFPFAFAPVQLDDIEAAAPGAPDAIVAEGGQWFPDHARQEVPFRRYSFADGGYLDNKPFTYATESLRRRRADVPVDRKLLYIEPDPGHSTEAGDVAAPRPDAVGNVGKAVLGLPRTEPIREDIAALLSRNEAIDRVRRVTRDVEYEALADGAQALPPAAALAYRRLRRLQVIEDLTGVAARAIGAPETGDQARFLGLLLDAWAADGGPPLTDFLDRLDFAFRLRRLAMLQERLGDLLDGEYPAARLLSAARSPLAPDVVADSGAEWLRGRKAGLSNIATSLRYWARAARAPATDSNIATTALAVGFDDMKDVLGAGKPRDAAAELLSDGRRLARIRAFGMAFYEHAAGALPSFDADVATELATADAPLGAELSAVLLRYLGAVERIDMTAFPLIYPDLGEATPVDVFRVSPEDADALVPLPSDKRRLAGIAAGHFGGFLDESWRRSDLLWGQLDGAERLIDVLIPEGPEREQLRVRAQGAILREELSKDTTGALLGLFEPGAREHAQELAAVGDDAELLDWFKARYKGPGDLDADRAIKLAGRGTAVTGEVLGNVADAHTMPSKPLFWLARLGRVVWGFAELAVPSNRFFRDLPRHWAQIALLVAALLIVAGIFLGGDTAQSAGIALAVGVGAILVLRWLIGTKIKTNALAGVLSLVAVAVLAAAATEVLRHLGDDLSALFGG